jgi:hypothetical protein
MEILLNIRFVSFGAMKEVRLKWPRITDDDVDVCMTRYVQSVKFGRNLDPLMSQELILQFVEGHPKQAQLAYVQVNTAKWLRRVTPDESDRFVMLALPIW